MPGIHSPKRRPSPRDDAPLGAVGLLGLWCRFRPSDRKARSRSRTATARIALCGRRTHKAARREGLARRLGFRSFNLRCPELSLWPRHIGCEKWSQLLTILRSDAATSRLRRCASIVGVAQPFTGTRGQGALMRVNIWIILAALLALLAITRYLQHQQDTQRICGDDPTAPVCQR